MTILNLTTKTIPDFLIFSSILYFVPKLLLEYWGRQLKVFHLKITICNFFVETKNKKSMFHVGFTTKPNLFCDFLLFFSYRSKIVRSKKSIFHDDFIEFNDKTEPYFFISSCFFHTGPKLLVEYWGRPMKVFGAKKQYATSSWKRIIRNLYFALTLLNLTTKTIPDFLIFSSILYFVPKLLLEYWGRQLKVFQLKITICNFFVETKNKKSMFHVGFTTKPNLFL